MNTMKYILSFKDFLVESKLFEGGAAGHMASVFEFQDLTFKELKDLIQVAVHGKFTEENFVTEKVDGMNLFITLFNNQLYAVRNKTQIKKGIDSYLSLQGVKDKFEGRGDIQDAFTLAMEDLTDAILSLSPQKQEEIFGTEGRRFMSIEIVYPATENTIPYGHSFIVFHGVQEYDESGEMVDLKPELGDKLGKMLKQINKNVQNTFTIQGPNVLKIKPLENADNKEKKYLSDLLAIMDKHNLKDEDTIYDYHYKCLSPFVLDEISKLQLNLEQEVIDKLLNRLITRDAASYPYRAIKNDIHNQEFIEWYKQFEEEKSTKEYTKNVEPIKLLFLKLGSEILANTTNLLAISNNDSKEKLIQKVEQVKKMLDDKEIESDSRIQFLERQLRYINEIGLDKLIPTEGFVINYNGKLLKFTGLFQVIHQFISFLKFDYGK